MDSIEEPLIRMMSKGEDEEEQEENKVVIPSVCTFTHPPTHRVQQLIRTGSSSSIFL